MTAFVLAPVLVVTAIAWNAAMNRMEVLRQSGREWNGEEAAWRVSCCTL